MNRRLLPLLLTSALTFAACEGGDELEPTVSGLYQITGGSDPGYYALPFPNELRLTSTGTIDVGNLAKGQPALIKIYFDEVAKNPTGGFALNGAISFRFDEAISTTCLPATAADTLKPGSTVALVNVDRTSSGYGERVPVQTKFSEQKGRFIGDNSLAVLPVPGFPLRPGTMYAVLLTDGLCDEVGAPIMAAADFVQLLPSATPAETRLAAAHKLYAPLRAYLDDKGITGLVSATLFRTGQPTEIGRLAREVVVGLPAPSADKLVVAYDGINYLELQGTYKAPNFQSGTPPFMNVADGGGIKVDSGGKPVAAFSETMRFALSVPKEGTMPQDGWPIVLYAHGTGGSYRTFISNYTAERLAQVKDAAGQALANLAVVGIDQNLHGPRAGGIDAPEMTFFNFQNPAASVHNVVQAGIDNYSLVRLVKALTATSIPWGPKSNKKGSVTFSPALKFDPKKIYFMGHSQGGLTGPVALAFEPEIKAAVLSGAGGGAIYSLLEKTAPTPVRTVLEMALSETVDQYHPFLSLLQGLLEPADPNNYARYMISTPPKGREPLHLLLTEGLVDHYTPTMTTEALALAMGVPQVGTVHQKVAAMELAGIKPAAGPVSGNITVGAKSVTGGLVQIKAPAAKPATTCKVDGDCKSGDYCGGGQCLRDGHFVVFQVTAARDMVSRFFGTMARDGVPTITP